MATFVFLRVPASLVVRRTGCTGGIAIIAWNRDRLVIVAPTPT